MILFVLFLGWAADEQGGTYTPLALFLLTIGAIFCFAGVALHLDQGIESFLHHRFTAILAVIALVSTLISTGILLYIVRDDPELRLPLLFLVGLGLLQIAHPRALQIPSLLARVIVFCVVSIMTFISPMCD